MWIQPMPHKNFETIPNLLLLHIKRDTRKFRPMPYRIQTIHASLRDTHMVITMHRNCITFILPLFRFVPKFQIGCIYFLIRIFIMWYDTHHRVHAILIKDIKNSLPLCFIHCRTGIIQTD